MSRHATVEFDELEELLGDIKRTGGWRVEVYVLTDYQVDD